MNAIGLRIWTYLYHPVHGAYDLKPNRLTLSTKVSTSESRCEIAMDLPSDLLSEISNRSDSTGDIYIIPLKMFDGVADGDIADVFIFNNRGFDFSTGPKSSTVIVQGTKYLTAETPVARTLTRFISQDRQKLGASYRTVYAVPPLDVIDWNPGDTLDGEIIRAINYNYSSTQITASIEVQP